MGTLTLLEILYSAQKHAIGPPPSYFLLRKQKDAASGRHGCLGRRLSSAAALADADSGAHRRCLPQRPMMHPSPQVASLGSKLSPTVPRSHSTAGVHLAELVSLPRRTGGCRGLPRPQIIFMKQDGDALAHCWPSLPHWLSGLAGLLRTRARALDLLRRCVK